MAAAAALQPRHWDPNIAPSSMTSSAAGSSRSVPLDSATDTTSLDHFTPSTARNSYAAEDGDMTAEQWTTLASTIGVKYVDNPRSSPEGQKFARKMSKRRNLQERRLSDLLLPVITSISNEHPRLLLTLSTTFNREAVPLDHPSFIFGKTRLPTPRPAITIGYNPQIFHPHYRELMQGIIADPSGQPRNLDKISHACPGTYWPFFAVEVNDDSYSPSLVCASAAAATATCNNALLNLASTLNDISNPIEHDLAFREMLTRSVNAFSLGISSTSRSATLLAHSTSFDGPYSTATDAVQTVRTYQLTQTDEVDALSARLKSIFAWAETVRLLSIMDLLDRFDERVQFRQTKLTQEKDLWGPMDMMQRGELAPKLMPGMVQLSGGMGKGISVPRPSSPAYSISTPSTGMSVSRGRSQNRDKAAGGGGGGKWMPDTPQTPESMNLTLNTKGAGAGVTTSGTGIQRQKKPSLFKTVLNDAMPAWTRVEM